MKFQMKFEISEISQLLLKIQNFFCFFWYFLKFFLKVSISTKVCEISNFKIFEN